MPRTSVCCRRGPDRRRGFTLLELLLVLTLAALATALVAPNIAQRLRQSEERSLIERVEDLLAGLPSRARQAQQASSWSVEQLSAPLALDPEPQLRLSGPLQYDARGLAAGGTVLLQKGERTLASWRIERHVGHVKRLDGAADAR